MVKLLIFTCLAAICGFIIGFVLGFDEAGRRAADGVCMRTDDGEAYLRISEAGQRKLLDPATEILNIKVIDLPAVPTRNNQTL